MKKDKVTIQGSPNTFNTKLAYNSCKIYNNGIIHIDNHSCINSEFTNKGTKISGINLEKI